MDGISELSGVEPWLFQGAPALVAHRGNAQKYPENTLLALKSAVDVGAYFLEFDIQLSKDGVPFLMHDDNFLRTAGLDACVFDLDMSQIESIAVGQENIFGGAFPSETPITLQALCSRLNTWTHVHSFIEIKRQSVEYFGCEKVVDSVLNVLDELSARHSIISFNDDVVRSVKARSNKSVGWVIPKWDEYSLQILDELSPDFVFCNYHKVPLDTRLPKDRGHWVLYDIDDLATAVYWRNRGADLIEAMAVEPMLAGLRGKTSEDE